MAYNIKGILKVSSSIKVQNNYVGIRIKFKSLSDVYVANSGGDVTIPAIILKPAVDSMFKNLPVTQFGDISNNPLSILTSSSNIIFNSMNPLFMAGQYFELPAQTINVNTVITGAGTVYVYVQLESGVPQYTISAAEIADSLTIMFIGTVTTNAGTAISAHTLQKVSRFEEFRPNQNQRGGSFPVSSGNPTQPGSINW